MEKIKVLITDTAPLYPPLWGGPKRIWKLFEQFPEDQFELHYAGISQHIETPITNPIKPHFTEHLFPFPEEYYRYWEPLHKSFFQSLSFDLFTYLFAAKIKSYKNFIQDFQADFVVLSHPWTSSCVQKKDDRIILYDAHNCELELMRSLTEGHPFAYWINNSVKSLEKRACQISHKILSCSPADSEFIQKYYEITPEKILGVPNGTSGRPLSDREEKRGIRLSLSVPDRKTAIFIGAYYKPNNEAAQFIVEELAPQLPHINFLIVGTVREKFRGQTVPENVFFSGYVSDEDLEKFLKASDFGLNPIISGSGVNIKMLDYLGNGLPTITTLCGVRGLKIENMRQAVITELKDFSQAIEQLCNDSNWMEEISKSACKFIDDYYRWEDISARLKETLLDLRQVGVYS